MHYTDTLNADTILDIDDTQATVALKVQTRRQVRGLVESVMCETRDLGIKWPQWHTLIFEERVAVDMRAVCVITSSSTTAHFQRLRTPAHTRGKVILLGSRPTLARFSLSQKEVTESQRFASIASVDTFMHCSDTLNRHSRHRRRAGHSL